MLLLLLTIFILPFVVPIDSYRGEILEFVQKKTGREIAIKGPMEFTLLPDIALQLNEVTVGNPEGFVSSHFAKVGKLNLKMALMPLLSQQAEINELVIENAEIFLEETVGGKKNWEFETANITKTSSKSEVEPSNSNFKLNIDSIFVENTKIHYLKPGQKFTSESLNLKYENNNALLDVVLKHAGTRYRIDAETTNTDSLFSDVATPLNLKVRSPLVRGDFTGKVEKLNLSQGKVDAQLVGNMTGQFTGLGKINSRKFSANAKEASLGLLTLETTKNVTATGDMVVNYAGKKPHIKTTLSIPELNVDALLEAQKKASFSIIRSAYASEPWSRDPVNLAMLAVVNADADLSISKLIASGYELSQFKSKLKLKSGNLNISNFSAALLGGNVSGNGRVNIKGNWNKTVSLKNVPFAKLAQKYIKDVAMTGTLNGNISLKSNGKSMHDWMHRLSGGGNFTISNGVIEGYSLPELFRKTIGLNVPKTVAAQVGEKTNFSAIKTAFSVDKGVIRLREGALRADRLKADASGSISLAGQSLDLLLTPELLPQIKQEEGTEPLSGLMVPIKVKGSFDSIKLIPDYSQTIGNLLKDPKNIEKTLKNFKTEGKAIEDSIEPTKDRIKENIKKFEDTKDPKQILNIINELDKTGLNPLGGLLGR